VTILAAMATSSGIGFVLSSVAADDSVKCPLATFARDLQASLTRGAPSIAEALTSQARLLHDESASIAATIEQCTVAKDKLTAELHRVEAQLQMLHQRRAAIDASSTFCRISLNAVLSNPAAAASTGTFQFASPPPLVLASNPAGGDPVGPQSGQPVPMPNVTATNMTKAAPRQSSASTEQRDAPPGAGNLDSIDALVAVLRLPDVKESSLTHALNTYDSSSLLLVDTPWTSREELSRTHRLIQALLEHLPKPRPPTQITEMRILTNLAKRSDTSGHQPIGGLRPTTEIMVQNGAIDALAKLLNSVNDDVKCEAFELLSHIVLGPEERRIVAAAGGVTNVVSIVASSTSEAVLERALIFLWGLIAHDDELRAEVRVAGGMRAVLDLLYTDSLAIIENVTMSIVYMTREEEAKVAVREAGGLEKITATLRHPSEIIQSKIAAAIWNCASNNDNRAYLRQLGAIPALIDVLLMATSEAVIENSTGALWNLAVDADNKAQILDYGGIPILCKLLKSSNPSVVENASGALWNCSATVENRPAIRKAGGIPLLLQHLRSPANGKIQENAIGTLRNCAINDQNKAVLRESGGIELLLDALDDPRTPAVVADKISSTLWIATVAPENKHAIRTAGGIPRLVKLLEASTGGGLVEKLCGIFRNCASVQENRLPLVEAKVIPCFVKLVGDCSSSGAAHPSVSALESIACTLWNITRDDKTAVRRDGGLQLLCDVLLQFVAEDQITDSNASIVEQTCGALHSLTVNTPENRDFLRENGTLLKIVTLLSKTVQGAGGGSQLSKPSPPMQATLLNVLLTVRNCTSANEANLRMLAANGAFLGALLSICEKAPEELAREAALCVKNASMSRQASEDLLSRSALSVLTRLAEKGTTDALQKAAASAIQSLSRYLRPGTR
jgi:hypothetical protein